MDDKLGRRQADRNALSSLSLTPSEKRARERDLPDPGKRQGVLLRR
jgi:hypothetical protein